MADLLPQDRYPDVRDAIDLELSESDIPLETIERKIYKNAAIQDVLDVVPGADILTGSDFDYAQNAAVFFCAARLCYVVVKATSISVNTRDTSYSKTTYDPEERSAYLKGLAAKELDRITESAGETTGSRPTMFARASHTRGH